MLYISVYISPFIYKLSMWLYYIKCVCVKSPLISWTEILVIAAITVQWQHMNICKWILPQWYQLNIRWIILMCDLPDSVVPNLKHQISQLVAGTHVRSTEKGCLCQLKVIALAEQPIQWLLIITSEWKASKKICAGWGGGEGVGGCFIGP